MVSEKFVPLSLSLDEPKNKNKLRLTTQGRIDDEIMPMWIRHDFFYFSDEQPNNVCDRK